MRVCCFPSPLDQVFSDLCSHRHPSFYLKKKKGCEISKRSGLKHSNHLKCLMAFVSQAFRAGTVGKEGTLKGCSQSVDAGFRFFFRGRLSSSLNSFSEGAGLGFLTAGRHPQREQELGRSLIAFCERAQGAMQGPFPSGSRGGEKRTETWDWKCCWGYFWKMPSATGPDQELGDRPPSSPLGP